MKRAFVTGAKGFIGKHLVERLKDYEVYTVPHDDPMFNRTTLLKNYLFDINPQYIFHFGGYGNHSFQTDEIQTYISNVQQTMNLLEIVNELPYKAFVFASTSAIQLPKQTLYTTTKHMAEIYCQFKGQDKPILSVRPASIYGPGEADFRFIPKVINTIKSGDIMDLALYSYHDWTYIDDFIDGLMLAVENIHSIGNKVVNIGTGLHESNSEIVYEIQKIMGKNLRYNRVDNLRSWDAPEWLVDADVLRSLGWEPKYSIFKGLERTVKYYAER
jgi:nucleoside-diphosphate-sugar epimerase